MRLAALLSVLITALPTTATADLPAQRNTLGQEVRDERTPFVWRFGHGQPETTFVYMHGLDGEPAAQQHLLERVLTPKGPGSVKIIGVWMRPEHGLHTMTDQLARARKVIQETPGPVFLLGYSFGGKAALHLATEFPKEKVPALITLAPAVNMLYAYWEKVTGQRGVPSPAVVESVLAQRHADLVLNLEAIPVDDDSDETQELRAELMGSLGSVARMRDLNHHDEPGVEKNVTRPTLVLHGSNDRAIWIGHAHGFAAANPNAVKLVELPDVGHRFQNIPPQTERVMADEIAAFVLQHRPTAPTPMKAGPARPPFHH